MNAINAPDDEALAWAVEPHGDTPSADPFSFVPQSFFGTEKGPGDDDDDDEPGKGRENGGNIDPDDDEGYSDDDDGDDDDDETLWATPGSVHGSIRCTAA